MEVQVSGSIYNGTDTYAQITRETLGITKELEEQSWEQLQAVFDSIATLHVEAVTQLCNRQAFAPIMQQEISDSLSKGNKFCKSFEIAKLILEKRLDIPSADLYSMLDETTMLIGKQISENVVNKKGSSDLIAASEELASSLNKMWQLAQQSAS